MNTRPKIFVIDETGTPRNYPLYRYSEVCVRRDEADMSLAGKTVQFILANVEYEGRNPAKVLGNLVPMTIQFDANGFALKHPVTNRNDANAAQPAGIVRPGDEESSINVFKLNEKNKKAIQNLIFGKVREAS